MFPRIHRTRRQKGYGAQADRGDSLSPDVLHGERRRRQVHSDKRQRAAIAAFAKANGFVVVDEFYDAAVSGADPVTERAGFKAMLARIAGNGVRTILVESPDRFARDLAVQLAGHDYLKRLGVELVPTSAPDFFTTDTPTAVLVRQVLGAITQFEKATLVAKLKAARERITAAGGHGTGRYGYSKEVPEAVAAARALRAEGLSLRAIGKTMAERGLHDQWRQAVRGQRRSKDGRRRELTKRAPPILVSYFKV